jgi:glycosyltransferase involved in cell wall biosynthesis
MKVEKTRGNILVIPLENIDGPNIEKGRYYHLLNGLKQNKPIIGVERTRYFGTNNELLKYIKLILYCFKTLWFGLRNSGNIDVIVTYHVAFSMLGSILALLTGKPLVCDIDDGNILYHCRITRSSFLFTFVNLLFVKLIGLIANVFIVPSDLDRNLYSEQKFKYLDKIHVLPSGIDFPNINSSFDEIPALRAKLKLPLDKKILIFIGKRSYFPNKEAAFWINNKLAPVLAREFQDVQIVICGSGEIPDRVHPTVMFTGFVPDVYEYIHASDICIVPYKLNTGISLKVLDSMACAKPVVMMSCVAKLFTHLVDGENVIIAEDWEDFPQKLILLLNRPNTWKQIGDSGKILIDKYYNWQVINNSWIQLVNSTIKKDNCKTLSNDI